MVLVAPFLISVVVSIAVSQYMVPFIVHAALQSPPDGMSGEQYASSIAKFGKIGAFVAPLTVAFFYALQSGLLLAIGILTGAKATFGKVFNLTAGCGIIQTLAAVASAAILHFKGEVNSMAELRPAMGPDIFLPEGTNKFVMSAMAGFSVFQIWWVVMMALIFAAAFGVSKAKGFAAVIPLWALAVLFGLAGAAFQK